MYLDLTQNLKNWCNDKKLRSSEWNCIFTWWKKLYIADTGENIKCLYVFDVDDQDNIINQKLVYDFKPFFSDGFRSDQNGNIWTSAGKAIKCFNPKREIIGQLLVPELVSNLEFGGKEGNILYVTATSSLYSMELNQIGAKYRKWVIYLLD